jgi:hypothetical protein
MIYTLVDVAEIAAFGDSLATDWLTRGRNEPIAQTFRKESAVL